MKKLLIIILAALVFTSCRVFAQPFLGFNANNRGVGVHAGFLFNNIEVTGNYKSFSRRNDVPKVLSLSAGYRVLLTQKEMDNWSVTPSIGVGNYRLKDFTAYDADPTGITGIKQISKYKPVYGVNLSRDSYLGQGFVSVDYCNKAMFYGIGIRGYLFYRKLENKN